MAIKCTQFISEEGILRVIEDYCFSKLFSCLGIGPRVSDFMGFDLVLYDGSVEYLIEKCEKIFLLLDKEAISKSLKKKLALMHSIGIVHRDIN